MKFSFRQPRSNSLDQLDHSLHFVAALPTRFSTPVSIRRHVRSHTRHLIVRGNHLFILTKAPPTSHDPIPASTLLHHTPLPSAPLRPTPLSISLPSLSLVLVFPSTSSITTFCNLHRPPPKPPTHLSRPVPVGHGATASVYATNASTALRVVPKTLVLKSDRAREQFIHERLLYHILSHHPFATPLKAAYETPTHFAFVTSLAHYGDLHNVLSQFQSHRLPEKPARTLFAELLLGLHDIHIAGFLFRDMKPANVLITRNAHVQLCDFGLVKPLPTCADDLLETSSVSAASDDDAEHSDAQVPSHVRFLKAANSFVGTRHYMAPEVCSPLRRRTYAAAADVWALGVTLYYMLTGRLPFRSDADDDDTSLYLSIANDGIFIPSSLSQDAADLLRGMLHKDALERWDMPAIRRCKWLRDIDWHDVRARAAMDAENHDVLSAFKEAGVQGLLARDALESDVEDSWSSESMGVPVRVDGGGSIETPELIGFDFVR